MQSRFDGFHDIGGVIGTTVSALFLLVIGIANLFVMRGVWAAFGRARRGENIVDEDLDALLAGSGFLARIFRPMFKVVARSWHMYPIGFLFGLGFDTATEIGVLGISAAQAAQGMSFWIILVFPVLFTAGMSLMDTTDSVLMTSAYGWALVKPIRKLWYNLTITAASVVVAVFIGGVEALGLLADKLGLEGGVWSLIGDLNDNLANFGYAVVAIFMATWLISVVLYRARGYDNLQISTP
jgi:high-affinity nickel-transport protein